MNLFLDTNILIDFVADRKPFSKWAYKLFQDQKKGKFVLHTSPNSLLTTYYILEKELGNKEAKKLIEILLSRLEILPMSKQHLLSALQNSFKDYEDGAQYECALSCVELDHFVTRNKRDFKHSAISVLSSEELYIHEK